MNPNYLIHCSGCHLYSANSKCQCPTLRYQYLCRPLPSYFQQHRVNFHHHLLASHHQVVLAYCGCPHHHHLQKWKVISELHSLSKELYGSCFTFLNQIYITTKTNIRNHLWMQLLFWSLQAVFPLTFLRSSRWFWSVSICLFRVIICLHPGSSFDLDMCKINDRT